MSKRDDLPDVEMPVRVRYFHDGQYDNVIPIDPSTGDVWLFDRKVPDGSYWMIPASPWKDQE